MKRITLITTLLLTLLCSTAAETITLRTGQQIQGEVILHNDEVVIIRDATGMRYQYPNSDVLSIEQQLNAATDSLEQAIQKDTHQKRSSIQVSLSGGIALLPPDTTTCGFTGIDLLIGSHHLLGNRIFLGGGAGYRAYFMGGKTYSFLPLQLTTQVPLLNQKHSPLAGASLGYGFALNDDIQGGLYAAMQLGYCCRINERSMMALTAQAQFQQTQLTTTEYINDQEVDYPFTRQAGRCWVVVGINLSFFL